MTHGSCFSGIGGFDLAAQWAGIKTTWEIENNPFCQKVLKKHFPEAKLYGDIHDVTKPESVDIISGGFPCQPFSCAGKRKGKADDRYLWPEMLRIITEVRPTWVIAENVAGIINMALDQVLADLEMAGYSCQAVIIPACALNAPHRRDRIWILAHAISNTNKPIEREIQKKNGIQEIGRPEMGGGIPGRTVECFITNTNKARCSQPRQDRINKHEQENSTELANRLSHQNINDTWEQSWLEIAARLCGIFNGIPNRLDRIKALGNSIVPQIAYIFFSMIKGLEAK